MTSTRHERREARASPNLQGPIVGPVSLPPHSHSQLITECREQGEKGREALPSPLSPCSYSGSSFPATQGSQLSFQSTLLSSAAPVALKAHGPGCPPLAHPQLPPGHYCLPTALSLQSCIIMAVRQPSPPIRPFARAHAHPQSLIPFLSPESLTSDCVPPKQPKILRP